MYPFCVLKDLIQGQENLNEVNDKNLSYAKQILSIIEFKIKRNEK